VVNGGEDADGVQRRGEQVADARPDLRRRAVLLSGDLHDAPERLRDEVERGLALSVRLAGPGVAEAADGAVDDLGAEW
jgi:hypothetical protein